MGISIIFGGASYEHEISIVSAIAILKRLEGKIEVQKCIFLDPNHEFFLIEKKDMKSSYFSSMAYRRANKIKLTMGGFQCGILGRLMTCGVLLNLVHGKDGEDGVLSSMFDFYNIDFIGPRTEACVISYDKHITKMYAKERGVDVLPFEVCFHNHDGVSIKDFPAIVKPARLGSSIGVQVIEKHSDVEYAMDGAFEFDEKVIVEQFVRGVKEYNLAGTKVEGEYIFSVVEEPKKADLLDFDSKYLDFSRSQQIVRADIDESLSINLQNEFKKLYENMFEGSIIRCDFFVINNRVLLNEINPVPGSMANYLFDDFESILTRLSANLPRRKSINVGYRYISKIHGAKAKL